MQAVILAGGLGTRLRPVTESIPKPMVTVAGRPYLQLQLEELARQDIRDIVLLTGYLGERIEEYFGGGAALGISLRYSREPNPLGTAGALRLAAALLDESFLLIYGDSYLPIDYRAVLKTLQPPALGLIVAYDNLLSDTSVRNNVDLDESGFVVRYEKDGENLRYVEAGVLAFRREAVDFIPAGRVTSLEGEIFPQLIARRLLLGYRTTQRFYDIGTPERLQVIEDLFTR
jgi:NDP-sugar pyrophosphorylase family protein